MKFIFLDIDGVLAHHGKISEENVVNLNSLISSVGADNVKVVFNTAWNCHSLEKMIFFLEEKGFRYSKCLFSQTEGCAGGGKLVRDWLLKNDYVGSPYVIVDDGTNQGVSFGRYVHCDPKVGLTNYDAWIGANILKSGILSPKDEHLFAKMNADAEKQRLINETPWLTPDQREDCLRSHQALINELNTMSSEDFMVSAMLKKS